MKTFGIDISNHQGNFNFKKAKEEGVKFVIIRGAWGTNKDKNFETYYKEAKEQGFDVGVYLYSYATTVAQAEAEAKRKAEAEALRKAEEAKRKAAEEAKRKAEEEAKAKKAAEEKARADAAKAAASSKMSGAFGNNGNPGSSGNTSGTGSQGSRTGNSNVGGTKGTGGTGTASSAVVGNRTPTYLAKPSYSDQTSEGTVVVSITVDSNGKVRRANVISGTTTTSTALRNSARDAALKSTFSAGSNNAESGTITYIFKQR